MAKAQCLLLTLSVITQIGFSQEFEVKGKIKVKDSSIVVLTDGIKSDTVITTTGNFSITRKPSGLLLVLLVLDKKGELISRKELFAEKGVVTIDTNYAVHLSHPELQLKYQEFRKRYDPVVTANNSLTRIYLATNRTKDERLIFDSISTSLIAIAQDVAEEFILENTDNQVGAYIFAAYLQTEKDLKKITSIYYKFDKRLYASSYALKIMKEKIETIRSLVPGSPIVLFSAVTEKGNIFTPDELKGKYAVLDFWATWCKPCVIGLPRMKQYYEKYKGKIEFVGIACRDNENDWQKTIKQYNLDWIQIFDTEQTEGLEKKYNVLNYPTKILVDPRGNLVEVFTGELDDFYSRVDELLNK
jgi:thiol-disulfide isomerase/thioredoxin